MTRIIFDSKGKPHWYTIPESGAYLHSLPDLYAQAMALDTTPPFTEADLDWFRKPLSR